MVVQESVKKAHSYQWVEVSKFFFCICIIAMHSNLPFKGIYWIEKLLFRLGVPFFFAASGFFLSMSYKTRGYKAALLLSITRPSGGLFSHLDTSILD